MLPSVSVLSLDGRGEFSSNYGRQVELRRHVTNLDPAARASALILHMDAVARHVCMAAGGNVIAGLLHDVAGKISAILLDGSAPEVAGSVCREVARFSQIERTGWTT